MASTWDWLYKSNVNAPLVPPRPVEPELFSPTPIAQQPQFPLFTSKPPTPPRVWQGFGFDPYRDVSAPLFQYGEDIAEQQRKLQGPPAITQPSFGANTQSLLEGLNALGKAGQQFTDAPMRAVHEYAKMASDVFQGKRAVSPEEMTERGMDVLMNVPVGAGIAGLAAPTIARNTLYTGIPLKTKTAIAATPMDLPLAPTAKTTMTVEDYLSEMYKNEDWSGLYEAADLYPKEYANWITGMSHEDYMKMYHGFSQSSTAPLAQFNEDMKQADLEAAINPPQMEAQNLAIQESYNNVSNLHKLVADMQAAGSGDELYKLQQQFVNLANKVSLDDYDEFLKDVTTSQSDTILNAFSDVKWQPDEMPLLTGFNEVDTIINELGDFGIDPIQYSDSLIEYYKKHMQGMPSEDIAATLKTMVQNDLDNYKMAAGTPLGVSTTHQQLKVALNKAIATKDPADIQALVNLKNAADGGEVGSFIDELPDKEWEWYNHFYWGDPAPMQQGVSNLETELTNALFGGQYDKLTTAKKADKAGFDEWYSKLSQSQKVLTGEILKDPEYMSPKSMKENMQASLTWYDGDALLKFQQSPHSADVFEHWFDNLSLSQKGTVQGLIASKAGTAKDISDNLKGLLADVKHQGYATEGQIDQLKQAEMALTFADPTVYNDFWSWVNTTKDMNQWYGHVKWGDPAPAQTTPDWFVGAGEYNAYSLPMKQAFQDLWDEFGLDEAESIALLNKNHTDPSDPAAPALVQNYISDHKQWTKSAAPAKTSVNTNDFVKALGFVDNNQFESLVGFPPHYLISHQPQNWMTPNQVSNWKYYKGVYLGYVQAHGQSKTVPTATKHGINVQVVPWTGPVKQTAPTTGWAGSSTVAIPTSTVISNSIDPATLNKEIDSFWNADESVKQAFISKIALMPTDKYVDWYDNLDTTMKIKLEKMSGAYTPDALDQQMISEVKSLAGPAGSNANLLMDKYGLTPQELVDIAEAAYPPFLSWQEKFNDATKAEYDKLQALGVEPTITWQTQQEAIAGSPWLDWNEVVEDADAGNPMAGLIATKGWKWSEIEQKASEKGWTLGSKESAEYFQHKLSKGGAPAISKQLSDVDPDDLAARLVPAGSAEHLGGAHEKMFYEDPQTGKRYLFKPSYTQTSAGPYAEEFANWVRKFIDPGTPMTKAVTLEGRLGSLQEFIEGATPVVKNQKAGENPPLSELEAMLKDMPGEDWNRLMIEHALDWLTSQHDTHSRQLLRTAAGKLMGVDKGQAGKFIGQDVLSTSYKPNPSAPIYNTFWDLVRRGEIDPNLKALFHGITALQSIPPNAFMGKVQPFVERASARTGRPQVEYTKEFERRHKQLLDDFTNFLSGLGATIPSMTPPWMSGYEATKLGAGPVSRVLSPKALKSSTAAGYDPSDPLLFRGTNRQTAGLYYPGYKKGSGAGYERELATFFGDEPGVASSYGTNVYPVQARLADALVEDWFGADYSGPRMEAFINQMKALGKTAGIVKNVSDIGVPERKQNQYLFTDPSQLRSIYADYDPSFTDLNSLLAAQAGVPLELWLAIQALQDRDHSTP